MKSKINILGTDYSIKLIKDKDESMKASRSDGYVDTSVKDVVVQDSRHLKGGSYQDDQTVYFKHLMRHELIHAFVYESGNKGADWNMEEMVDWLAMQFPKMLEAFQKADVL